MAKITHYNAKHKKQPMNTIKTTVKPVHCG